MVKHVIMEKDRTLGAKDLQPRKHKFRVTGTKEEHLWVEAFDRAEAVRLAKEHGIVAQYVHDPSYLKKPKRG